MEEPWTAVFLGPFKAPWEGLHEDLKRYRIVRVLAADSGAMLALNSGLMPELVVGDMDSLGEEEREELLRRGVAMELWPEEKDYTDFEILLRHLSRSGSRNIVVVGGVGGRLDHTLVNLEILSRQRFLHTSLLFPEGVAFLIRPGEVFRWRAMRGRVVSVVPLTERAEVESSEGFKWQLKGMRLVKGSGKTIHNIVSGGEIQLKLKRGRALVILFREGIH